MIEFDTNEHPKRRQRQKDQRNRQVLDREKTQPPVGQNLGVIDYKEKHHDRAHMDAFVEPLGQQIHRDRWKSGVDDKASESRNRTQCVSDWIGKRSGGCFFSAGAEKIDKKYNCDDIDFVIVGSPEEYASISNYDKVFIYPLIERKFENVV